MEIHNTTEDIVFTTIDEICASIESKGNPDKLCLCERCRTDVACFVLNRVPPYYIISNRGAARIEQETIKKQQSAADTATLVFEAFKRVSHNQRPNSNHSQPEAKTKDLPAFNIPTIVGRVFNGINFSPMANVSVELWRDGILVPMKDQGWQNPYSLVANTQGTFTFWPESIPADTADIRKPFEYSIRIESEGLETLNHFFQVPVVSESRSAGSFSMGRTFKLPDLYMFPPGGDDD
ncbi:conserved hypothetical protein [Treponema primitia ZAS-2]|uniref:Competence protein ComFB n=1 Tax=Treponema primitia (strain ATCC BAA-887 / DSM 12427 / ZAS-2) TaxID=545694 RepID=F5YJZ6_TREPZ|nr:late competence development ComFB family protein [Treponema primitia]AEF84482.1 conserved hypothetical protein [Treponema primitia ZAS-2]